MKKNRTPWTSAALAAASVLAHPGLAAASSHREAPAIALDPVADNTDLYAWVEPQTQVLVILASYIPFEVPAAGPSYYRFGDDVLYEIHLARGDDPTFADVVKYQVKFSSAPYVAVDPADPTVAVPAQGNEFFSQLASPQPSQRYSVTKVVAGIPTVLAQNVPVAPPNIGSRTNGSALAYGLGDAQTYEGFFVDSSTTTTIASLGAGQGRVFAGPRDDGFYADLGALFDLVNLPPAMPMDTMAHHNVHTIALEIPLTVANGGAGVMPGMASDAQTVGVWASASRRRVSVLRRQDAVDGFGPWVQVSRLGVPLVNDLIIGLQDKDRWNRLHPRDDAKVFQAYYLNPIIVRDAAELGLYDAGLLGNCAPGPSTFKQMRSDVVAHLTLADTMGHTNQKFGDVLRVDLGITSVFPNGRALRQPKPEEDVNVADAMLELLLCPDPTATFGVGLTGVSANDATFRGTFPYLATPWAGSL
jgi:hypothetical protein